MKDPAVRDIMTPWLDVLRQDTKLSEARSQLLEGHVHHLPIVAPDGTLLGLVTSADLLRLSLDAYGVPSRVADAVLDTRFSLSDVMSTELVTVGPEERVSRAAELLAGGEFHALPVVGAHGHLLGIVTSRDLIGFLCQQLR